MATSKSDIKILWGVNFVVLLLVLMAGSCSYLKHHPDLVQELVVGHSDTSGKVLAVPMARDCFEKMVAKAKAKYDVGAQADAAEEMLAGLQAKDGHADQAQYHDLPEQVAEVKSAHGGVVRFRGNGNETRARQADTARGEHADVKTANAGRAIDTLNSAHKASRELNAKKHQRARRRMPHKKPLSPPVAVAAGTPKQGGILPHGALVPFVIVGSCCCLLMISIVTLSVVKYRRRADTSKAAPKDDAPSRTCSDTSLEEGEPAPFVSRTLSPAQSRGALPDGFWSSVEDGGTTTGSAAPTLVHVGDVD